MKFLDELVDLVGEEFDEFQDPLVARGECYLTSRKIHELVNWDERTSLIQAEHLNDPVGRLKNLKQHSDHYAIHLPGEDKVLDYTLRQFDPDTSFPFVGTVTEWLQILSTSWDTTDVIVEYNAN